MIDTALDVVAQQVPLYPMDVLQTTYQGADCPYQTMPSKELEFEVFLQ